MNAVVEEVVAQQHEDGRLICPECGPDRRHNNPTLSVTVESDGTLYKCHHCGVAGKVSTTKPIIRRPQKRERVAPIPTKLNTDRDIIRQYFSKRGVEIPPDTKLPAMTTGEKYFPQLRGKAPAIGFIYGQPDQPQAIKWRPLDGRKAFTQDGAAQSLYGIGLIPPDSETVVMVEGECDAIALMSIGVPCVSVPNGAPMKCSANHRIDPGEDTKFAYIWEARELLRGAKKIILAVDQDQPGEALAEEISRRVDRAKCWRTKYPEGCKDITDVIVKHGRDAALAAINKSEPMPLQGVYSASGYREELWEFYRQGYGSGETTGFPLVDEIFTIKEGMLYVVTGYPGHGKSEWVDQIMMNLALKRQWKFAVASFENPPAIHIAKLAEKMVGRPFLEGNLKRIQPDELDSALHYIDRHFVFLENRSGDMPTVASIIDRTKQAVMRLGVRGLVIDPFNYIRLEGRDNEHQDISDMLSEISTFAKAYGIAVFFVAHPIKIYPNDSGKMPVPKGNHISGSAAWWAKADIGMTVHRGDIGTEIHCWKARFKWLGQLGQVTLGYDIPTGRYFERAEDAPGGEAPAHWADIDGWND